MAEVQGYATTFQHRWSVDSIAEPFQFFWWLITRLAV